jgi:hypothetical protein
MLKILALWLSACLCLLAAATLKADSQAAAEAAGFNKRLHEKLFAREDPLIGQYRDQIAELWTEFVMLIAILERTELDTMADQDLNEIFMALNAGLGMVGNDLPRERAQAAPSISTAAHQLLRVLNLLADRSHAGEQHYIVAHNTLFGLRLWEFSALIRPHLEYRDELPEIVDELEGTPGPTLWYLEELGKRMVRRRLDGGEPAWLALGSPGCGPTRAAAAGIMQDPELLALFRGRSMWMMRPGTDESSFRWVRVWFDEHPEFPFTIIDHLDDWPMINLQNASPTFIRVHAGAAVGHYIGWPVKGYEHVVRERLLAIEAEARALEAAAPPDSP